MKEILYLGGDAYTAPIFLVRYPNERCYVSEEDQTGYTCLWQVGVIGRDLQQNIRSVILDNSYMAQSTYLSEWGYLEYANGESDPRSSTALFLGRGFGSHEQILEFGLVHMNARMYDPTIGRFLSPDPVIQDPTNSQNFNRYTYCLNNPLMYGDPTGMMSYSYDGEDPSAAFEINEQRSADLARRDYAKETKKLSEILNIIVTIRILQSPNTTVSLFYAFSANKIIQGFFLEPGGPSTTKQGTDHRIPAGDYKMKISHTGNLPNCYVIYNEDVPESRGIKMHTGNTKNETEACYLPGEDFILNNGDYEIKAKTSRPMYDKLMDLYQRQDIKLIVTEDFSHPYNYYKP